MGITLKKGQGISLRKDENDLSTLTIGLGWDVSKPKGSFLRSLLDQNGDDYDLDAIAFLLGKNGKVNDLGKIENGRYTLLGGDVVFYNSMRHPSGKIWLTGDNRTGAGDGDDEQIIVRLSEMPDQFDRIVFVVSIYQGIEKKQNFGAIENAFIRAVDAKGKEIARYNISGDASFENYHSITFAEVAREGSGWKLQAIGTPHKTDSFSAVLKDYLPS
ncbi:MAG: TerD family protein [Atribacterota bacterium]|jgi:stress response protein SCP2|nr:TerD family protein [Atribacterota bacterium]